MSIRDDYALCYSILRYRANYSRQRKNKKAVEPASRPVYRIAYEAACTTLEASRKRDPLSSPFYIRCPVAVREYGRCFYDPDALHRPPF